MSHGIVNLNDIKRAIQLQPCIDGETHVFKSRGLGGKYYCQKCLLLAVIETHDDETDENVYRLIRATFRRGK